MKKRIVLLFAIGMVLSAEALIKHRTVIFDKQGGSGGTDTVEIRYNDEGLSSTYDYINPKSINTPSRAGYSFDGYYSSPNGNGDIYFSSSGGLGNVWWHWANGVFQIPDTVTVYASWRASGSSGGGSGSGSSGGANVRQSSGWQDGSWKDPNTGYLWEYREYGVWTERWNSLTESWHRDSFKGGGGATCLAVSPKPTGDLIMPSFETIGPSVFWNCGGLRSVTIPDGVKIIGVSAFADCSRLTSVTIPDSVTTIYDSAFANSGLTSVTIPNSVTHIGWGAFYHCRGLKSVTIPDSVNSLGDRAFYECTGLTSITTPDTGRDSFAYCSSLTDVILCSGVRAIAEGAFRNCSKLANLTIPGSVTSIGDSAFSGCSGLTSVTIPGSVTSVGSGAFLECGGLTNVTICNGATAIESSAFSSCSSLMSIRIPSSVTSIGDNAFYGCGALANIYVSQGDVDRVSGLLTDSGFDVSGVNFIETIDCPVIFDPQGGTGGWESVMATYGFAMPPIIIPTRAGYAFGGYWTGAYGRGVQYYGMYGKSVRAWDKTSETTLFAKWVGPSVITFDQQGGSGGTLSVTAVYGSAMPFITVPTRNGYTFGGYYSSESGAGTQYYNESGESALVWDRETATTLYAKWGYKVSLDQQDGEGGTSSVVAAYDGAMPTISVPNRTGYTFCGYWSGKNGEGTQYYTASGKSAHDWDKENAATLYAKWQANQYTVTFDANGGTGGGISVTQDYGTTLVAPTVTRENYIHTGWTPDFTGTVPASNTVYLAQWCCYFAVDKNADGTITINGVNFLPDEDYEIPSAIDGSLVTRIASNAFKDCTSLRSIKIPSSVTSKYVV